MIPIKLRIKGLYSYQQEAEIDFERLIEGRLFGIFGPVGSGKSTLLEAITFALYGRSERLDARGQNYNMMNLRSNELLIDYIFALGGEQYRFEVTGRRNSNKFEEVRTFKRMGYIWKQDAWVPLPTNDGGQLLGLSYENFTKTIIIPQGKFKDFLHLTPGARTQMLKELFELERFDLLRPTSELLSQNKERLDQIKGQLLELPDQDPTEFRAQEKALQEKEAEKVALDATLAQLQERKTEMKAVKELVDSLEEVRETLVLLEASEAEFKEREAFLDRYELADRHFREALEQEQRLESLGKKATRDVVEFQQQEQKIGSEIVQAEEKFKETKAAYERREELKHRAEEMKRMQEMQELDAEIQLLQGRIDKGNAIVREKEIFCREKAEAEKQLGAEIEAKRKGMGDVIVLTELKTWFQERAQAEKEVAVAQEGVEEVETEMAAQVEEEKALRGAAGEAGPEAALATQQELLLAAQTALDQLRLQSQLADFAAALEAGAPCPLCGATDHPSPYDAGHADVHLAEAQARREAAEAEVERLRRLALDLEQVRKQLRHSQARLEGRQAGLVKAEAALARQVKTFRWPDYADLDAAAVEAAIATVAAARAEVATLETGLANARTALRQAEQDVQRFAEKIAELKQQQAGLTGRHAALWEQLVIFDYKNHQKKPPNELNAKEHFFIEQYETVTRNYQREDRLLVERKDVFQKLKTDIQLAQQDAERCAEELQAVRTLLTERLEAHQFPDLDAVRAQLADRVDLIGQRREIDNYRQRLQALRTEFASYDKQLNGRTHDAEALLELTLQLDAQQAALGQLNQAIGELKNKMAEMSKDMAKRLALESRKDALQDRGDNLSTLRNLFIGSGFVNYVSTMYLHELCHRANDRFQKLTRNRLSLIVRDDNTFQVRDMVNDGQVRSVKTLSGGQTFQASLSLALALADNIQHRSESQHKFFFLDEGFGTLDRESLQIVFDTLKQLRREDRIVGVISHVEEMQQEIDQCLNVRQEEEKGSFVKGSWE